MINNVRYIERFSTTLWKQQIEYNYMDATLSYTGVPKTSFSGIEHLEGREIVATVDGVPQTAMTVVSGSFTLNDEDQDFRDEIVVKAGLAYSSAMITSRLNPKSAIGSSLGRRQVILDVNIMVDNTYELEIGPDEDNTEEFDSFVPNVTTMVSGTPILYTGFVSRSFPTGYDDELFVTCKSDQPAPASILNIGCLVKTSDM
jgi:hypothetical protein